MDVKLEFLPNDIVIIHLKDFLNFETSIIFEKDYLSTVYSKKVIFDFEHLQFVGSCGLVAFVQTLNKFCQYHQPRPRFACVSPEFVKFMDVNGFGSDDFYDSIDSAIRSYHYGFNPQKKRLGYPFF